MSLLKPTVEPETVHVKAKILKDTDSEIEAYIAWAGLRSKDEFFQQAAELVFRKDSDWKKHKKAQPQPHSATEAVTSSQGAVGL